MKIFMPIILTAIFLVGCERIEGQLNITKDLKLINSKGSAHLLKVGTYNADLLTNSSKKITLRLNDDSAEKYIFNDNGNIPDNGPFSISSKVSGQPVDLSGDVAKVQTDSEIRYSTDSCTYEQPVQVCRRLPKGGTDCTVVYRTVNGTQLTKYFDRNTIQTVNVSVKKVSSSEESADFHGDISYTDRVVISQTICR